MKKKIRQNARVKKLTIKSVLAELCQLDPTLLKSDGTPNHNEITRRSGVPQPTVSRAFKGGKKDPERETMGKLAAMFNDIASITSVVGFLTIEQLFAREQIPGLFLDDKYDYPIRHIGSSTAEQKIRGRDEIYSELTPDKQLAAVAQIADSASPRDLIAYAEYFLARAKAGLPKK